MASTTLTTPIRRRLSTFAKGLARPFTDSRRRNFVCDMLTGLVAAGHVHLTAVARGISGVFVFPVLPHPPPGAASR